MYQIIVEIDHQLLYTKHVAIGVLSKKQLRLQSHTVQVLQTSHFISWLVQLGKMTF